MNANQDVIAKLFTREGDMFTGEKPTSSALYAPKIASEVPLTRL